MVHMEPRDFAARYVGDGEVQLYCRRCLTREEGIQLTRVQDAAEKHAQWWHPGPRWATYMDPRNFRRFGVNSNTPAA